MTVADRVQRLKWINRVEYAMPATCPVIAQLRKWLRRSARCLLRGEHVTKLTDSVARLTDLLANYRK
jgi:hypothetical protein